MNKALKTAFLILPLFFSSGILRAYESAKLEVLEMNEKLAALLSERAAPPPEKGCLRVIGSLGGAGAPDFKIASINNLRAKDVSSGKYLPLAVDESGIVEEFGRIVSLWVAFDAPESGLDGGSGFVLEWGDDVESPSRMVKNLKLDPAHSGRYRTFSLNTEKGSKSFASIEVIADSSADYYFLWYLLPMALIFAVLTAGKMRFLSRRGGAGLTE